MRVRLPFLCALLLATAASAAAAQAVPFGKNKIQYRDFDWHVISGDHVDVYYYPEEESVARLALAYAEQSYAFLERKFDHHPFRRIPLIVYASHQHFEQTNLMPGFIPEGVLGFTEYLKRRVALPFRGDYEQFRHTLRHELVHAFQISKLEEVQRLHPRIRHASPQAIHWWTEGLAEYWSSEQTAEDEMFVRDLVVNDRLPSIRDFTYMYSFASYPLGAELHKYLAHRFGEEYIVQVYENYWKYSSFEETLEAVTGEKLDQLSREWEYALEKRFYPQYAERPPLDIRTKAVVFKGGANFKPVLYTPPGDTAPDLLFLSPRDGYTNLYRTRLDRGERGVQTVVKGERSAEFESFHAYDSRIDVNRRGVVALISKVHDRDALLLWDLEQKRLVGRYQWPDLVGLESPAWDPSGERIVFEGLTTSGFSDLYTFDIRTQKRRTLTDDRYRDEDPDWSPDGRTIVFASDRAPTGAEGNTNLFLFDLDSAKVRPLTSGAWHDQDPRWSHDGRRVVFSSDRAGSYDLYSIDPAGNGRRLTAMTGGAFDPEWLPGDKGLVYAGFANGRFAIYRFDFDADTARGPTVALEAPPPVADGARGIALVTDSAPTRPAGWTWDAPGKASSASAKRYDKWHGFSIDLATGDAMVAPGFGAAQGVQFLASDMLGDHLVFLGVNAAQYAKSLGDLLDNFSGQTLYLNLRHRLNFGAGFYRYRGLFRDVAWDVYQESSVGGMFLASYPFSKFRRVEFQLGLENSNRRDVSSLYTLFQADTAPDPRNLTRKGVITTGFASYVKDNTLWIDTGPIDGERYNISAGFASCFACTRPGSDSTLEATIHNGVLAEHFILTGDYRRYFRTSLLTAYSIRAFGFFSDGAIPGRAILGGTNLLRGYPRYSLAGSRVLLLNQEWRFPLLHAVGLDFPVGRLTLPGIQGAFFGDVGSSWHEKQTLSGAWGSYGLGLRMSLGSPLVLRLDVGHRFKFGDAPPVVFGNGDSFNKHFVDFFFGYNY